MVGVCLVLILVLAVSPLHARTTDRLPLAGATAELFTAVEVNDMPGVKRALAAGADLAAKNAGGKTAADLAVDRGHFIIAHFLLSQRQPSAKRKTVKTAQPTPRRLTPAPRAARPAPTPRKSVSQPLQGKRRFAKPPPKPAPASSAADALDGARGLTPPPMKSAKSKRLAKRRFQLPPRKPPAPLPSAVSIAQAPGLDTGEKMLDEDLPDLEGSPDAEDALAELPAAEDADALPDSKTEVAEKPTQPLGPVGEFFQSLLDLVKPDQPAQPSRKPRQTATSWQSTQPQASRKPESDDELADDLERELGMAKETVDDEDLPTISESEAETETDRPAGADADLAELKELETLADEIAVEDGKAVSPAQDRPAVRRIEPDPPEIRRTVQAPKVAPDPLKAPSDSTTSRTFERLEEMVGDKPKEDEFGLPEVEITGTPESAESLPELPEVVRAEDDEPSIESLLDDAPTETIALPTEELPETVEAILETPAAAEDRTAKVQVPNLDDEPGPELPDKTVEDDLPSDEAATPRAAPTAPVMADAAPRSRARPRFMSTADRLRRLNEALSRDVPLGTPSRQHTSILTDKVTDFMITGVPPGQSRAPAVSRGQARPPPSMLPTRPLTQRPAPSDRFIDRLERIRRETYDDERVQPGLATPAPQTPQIIARRPQVPTSTYPAPTYPAETQRARAPAQSGQAAQAARATEPPAPVKEDTSPLGRLVQFFKRAEGRKDEAAMAAAERQAARMRQQAYAKAPDAGPPKAALDTPSPLAKEALKATGEETAEPRPGQTAGKMTPGFMQHLSRLFTDEKVAERGWAAEVEVQEPNTKPAEAAPVLRPVRPSALAQASTPALTPRETAPLPPPTGDVPADTGGTWTTTVEMATDTGDPMVLGVVKTPVPQAPRRRQQTAPDQMAEMAPAPAEDLPPSDDLPPAENDVAALKDDLLPLSEEDDLPPAEGDDLPPAEGELLLDDDLPPAEGEAPIRAARPKPVPPPAPLPYSDPLRPPDPVRAAPKSQAPPLSRLAELPSGPDAAGPDAGRPQLRPDERLATGVAEPRPGQTPTTGASPWRITELAKSDAPPPLRQRQVRPELLSRTSLAGTILSLGESVSLENSVPPGGGIDADNQCVKKNRGTTLFCVEPVDWPDDLKPKFVVPTILYTGPMAIVRYDQGTASRLHALFPSDEFESVAQYYQTRYGPPTEIWKRSIAPLAQPRRENPTLAWRNRDPKTNAVTILELRRFDDTRGGFPDTQRGAVMLYLANSPAIFPQVSSHELMRLKRDAAKEARQAAEG